jgi:hypothetical protein
MIFVCQDDTGERKEFFPDSYDIDNTTMRHTSREINTFHFLRAEDDYRIDRMPDGTFQDKWKRVWLPEDE